jgi:hypothetical protein
MPGAIVIMALMATRHDNGEHLLIAYGVAQLCWRYALRPKGNREQMAFVKGCPDTCGASRAVTGVILLLLDTASYR